MKPIASPAPEPDFALENFVPYRLSVLTNTVSGAIAALYRDRFGLTIPEWRCLAVLFRYAPQSAGEVAARTAMDKVQVSRAIAALVAKGLALQATDRSDRRRAKLALSAAGKRMHDQIIPLARATEARLLDGLDIAERAQLDRIFAKLESRAATLA